MMVEGKGGVLGILRTWPKATEAKITSADSSTKLRNAQGRYEMKAKRSVLTGNAKDVVGCLCASWSEKGGRVMVDLESVAMRMM